MIPARISGANIKITSPSDWDRQQFGPCSALVARRETLNCGLPVISSAWEPTPEELIRLAAGAKVILTVVGQGQPAVALHVGEIPK